MLSYVIFDHPIVRPPPSPWDHNLNKIESKIPEDASKKFKFFWSNEFLRKVFENC